MSPGCEADRACLTPLALLSCVACTQLGEVAKEAQTSRYPAAFAGLLLGMK